MAASFREGECKSDPALCKEAFDPELSLALQKRISETSDIVAGKLSVGEAPPVEGR